MTEYLIIIGKVKEEVNWSAIEAISTLISNLLILSTLIFTIYSTKKQISFEREKYEQAISETYNRQRQQTCEIAKEFFRKKEESLLGAISFLNDKINTLHFLLNEKNITYLDKLKEQAAALQVLVAKKKRLEFESGQLTDAELYKIYQNGLQSIIEQIGQVEVWFAERMDKIRTEI